MAQLVVEVPDQVATDLFETIAWIRVHLDENFELEGAVTQALLAWIGDVRLDFMAEVDEVPATPTPVGAVSGGAPVR